MRTVGMALALCLVLAGCGGGGDDTATPPKAKATTKVKPSATPSAKPTRAAPTGVPAPQALSDFQCFPDDKGIWNSTGLLENTSKKSVTYQVTVFVGQANGKDAKAMTKPYAYVRGGTSVRVELKKLPAPGDAKQCYVQVLAKTVGS